MGMSDESYKRIVDAHRRGGGDSRDELIEVHRETAAAHRRTIEAQERTIASLEAANRHKDEAIAAAIAEARVAIAKDTARWQAITATIQQSNHKARETLKRLGVEVPDGPAAPSL
jgi:hypothetical protein